MGSESQNLVEPLIQRIRASGFINYSEIDPLLTKASTSALDLLLTELEKSGARIKADIIPSRAEQGEFHYRPHCLTEAGPNDDLYCDDPVRVYRREVGKVPVLNAQREDDLVLRRDEKSEREPMESQLALVIPIAESHQSSGAFILDLIICGNEGLMRAVKTFRPGNGYRLKTYATLLTHQALAHLLGPGK